MGDSEFAAELAALFIDDVAEQMEALSSAFERRDYPRIAGIAHRVKGSSGNLGAEELQRLCGFLEQAGRNGVIDDMPERLEEIVAEFALVRKDLEAVVDAAQ